jgi:hypothetical protein
LAGDFDLRFSVFGYGWVPSSQWSARTAKSEKFTMLSPFAEGAISAEGTPGACSHWSANTAKSAQSTSPPGSPCIDAGNCSSVPLDTLDLDDNSDTSERIPLDLAGHARFADDPVTEDTGVPDPPDYLEVVDIGAYERYEFCDDINQALKGDLNLDCYVNLLDLAIMAQYWLQYVGPE